MQNSKYNEKSQQKKTIKNSLSQENDSIIEDLEENVPGVVPTISHHVSLTNGYLRNSEMNNSGINMKIKQRQQQQQQTKQKQLNGNIPNGGFNFRQMLEEDSYI